MAHTLYPGSNPPIGPISPGMGLVLSQVAYLSRQWIASNSCTGYQDFPSNTTEWQETYVPEVAAHFKAQNVD